MQLKKEEKTHYPFFSQRYNKQYSRIIYINEIGICNDIYTDSARLHI